MSAEARVVRYHADALDMLPTLPDDFVESVVTDPPYELGFMGRAWDASGIAYNVELWKQCFRVLKPGGHLLAFGGTRTSHRLAVAVEDAGFEIRDSIVWIYGSGFPKSLDVSKAIDKAAGAQREVVGTKLGQPGYSLAPSNMDHRTYGRGLGNTSDPEAECAVTAPATDDAKRWAGWGTALKPAHEPIVVARKPLVGTVAANVLVHGTGALNIDACRVEHASDADLAESLAKNPGRSDLVTSGTYGADRPQQSVNTGGRWPANVVLDEDAAAELDEQSGITRGSQPSVNVEYGKYEQNRKNEVFGEGLHSSTPNRAPIGDTGGASRFFPVFRYQAKAPTRERPKYWRPSCNCETDPATLNEWSEISVCANCGAPAVREAHSTVKPLELMRWLVRLVTQPDGVVLDPFAGSGTTVEACVLEGMRCLAIEREESYLPLIAERMERAGLVAW